MTSIGGPGGIGGPKGPGGPTGPDEPDNVDGLASSGEAGDVRAAGGADAADRAGAAAHATGARELDALAADLAAGRLSPHEVVDKLVDQIAGSEQLGAGERAELRALLSDLVATDPYLQGLVGRL